MKTFRLFSVIIISLILILAVSSTSYAGNIKVVLNGNRLNLNAAPITKGGLVFVPLRGIFEKMGAGVNFDKSEGKIIAKRGKTGIELTLGNSYAKVNGFSQRMLEPPFVLNGTTYVPLRFLSESMGAEVGWHPPTSTVFIMTKKGKTKSETQDYLKQQIDAYLKSAKNTQPKEEEDKGFKDIKPGIKNVKKIEPIQKSPSPGKKVKDDDDDLDKDGDIEDIKLDDN